MTPSYRLMDGAAILPGTAVADAEAQADFRWNTALVTTSYILSHPSLSRHKRVLELGAGGGLPSLGCALAGAKTVLITDYADASLVENIEYNVESNLGGSEEGRAVKVLGHVWGHDVTPLLECQSEAESAVDDPLPGNVPNFDLVILSDLMFNHSQHAALMKTLEGTLRGGPVPQFIEGKTPCALVFFTHHRPWYAKEDMAFIEELGKKGWQCDRVAEQYTGAMFEDDPGDERVRGTVHGFRCWRSSAPREPQQESEEDKAPES